MKTPDGYDRPFDPYARERSEAQRETIRSGYRTREEELCDLYSPDSPATTDEE